MSDLVGNPEDRFSHNETHIIHMSHRRRTEAKAAGQTQSPLRMLTKGFYTMTKADNVDSFGDSNDEEENATAKEMNHGETETVDKSILDTGLENDKEMALSLNRSKSSSNGNIPDIKTTEIDGSAKPLDDNNEYDGRTLNDANNGALDAEMKKVGEILNKSSFHQESEKEDDGLIPNAEKENTQDESLRNVPIDRGWAWVILFGKTL